MSALLPLPAVSAVLLADQVIVEAVSNKKTLVGLYSSIFAHAVPIKRYLNFYIELTDAQGVYDFVLEVIYLEKEQVIARGEMTSVVAQNRLSSLEMVVGLPAKFMQFGTYEFRVSYANQVFAVKVFRVKPATIVKSSSSTQPGENQ